MIKEIIIRARGVILNDDKILVVRHLKADSYYALPGGKLEWGEDPKTCIKREIFEEFGVEPKIGRLLYINSFVVKDFNHQTVEFIFEILNTKDYTDPDKLNGTHRGELLEVCWINKNDRIKILPEVIQVDFNNGKILSDIVRFID